MALAINTEYEQQAVITILNGSEGLSLLGRLKAEHFGDDCAQEIFNRVVKRVQSGRDIPRRNIMLGHSALSDAAKQYLANIEVKPLKRKEDIEHLMEGLNFHRKIRLIIKTISSVKDACKAATQDTVHVLEGQLDQLTLDVKGGSNAPKIVNFGEGDEAEADAVIASLTANKKDDFIPTGFDYFDSRAGGFRRSNAVLIAGPTGGGKSALASQLLLNMYMKANLKVMMVTLEMNRAEYVGRMVANGTGIEHTKIERRVLSPQDAIAIQKWHATFKQHGKDNNCWHKIWCPDEGLTASNVVSYARPLKPDVLVVDYIGLLSQDNEREEQWRSLGEAMRQFKIAAARMGCCIIVLAQFDQENLVVKYSRALREHANVFWSWIFGPQEQATGQITICQTEPMGKNRNCQPFNFRLKFDLKYMRILDGGASDDLIPKLPKKNDVKPDSAVKKLPVARTTPGLVDDD